MFGYKKQSLMAILAAGCMVCSLSGSSNAEEMEIIEVYSGAHVVAVEQETAEPIDYGSYVTSSCVYMNPLSSFYPFGGDSGQIYHVHEDTFTIENKVGDYSKSITGIEWGWETFPYTDEEWNEMYFVLEEETAGISTRYDEMLYQPISDKYSLMRMDGELWLVEKHDDSYAGSYIWSIYTLVPEDAMGQVQWEFSEDAVDVTASAPASDSALSILFDMDCAEISFFASTGCLIGVDDVNEGTWQKGMNLTVPADTPIYWSPIAGGQQVYESEINFYVKDDEEQIVFSGSIYLTADETDGETTVYTAKLACGLLVMEDGEENGSAVIKPVSVREEEENNLNIMDCYTFYATLSEKFDNGTTLIKGLEINNINYRSEFWVTIDEDTRITWRGIEIDPANLEVGDIVSVTFTGMVQEVYPPVIAEPLVKLEYLGDRSMEQ